MPLNMNVGLSGVPHVGNDIGGFVGDTTPELFAEIKMNWMDDGAAGQKTDVVSLNAEVVDVSEEAERYIVSVRFTGLLREDANTAPEAIDETWHLTKPRSGNSGWLVAGIQQNA